MFFLFCTWQTVMNSNADLIDPNVKAILSMINTLIKAFGTDHYIWVDLFVKLLLPPCFKLLESFHLYLYQRQMINNTQISIAEKTRGAEVNHQNRKMWHTCWNWSIEIGFPCREIFCRALQSFNRLVGICTTRELQVNKGLPNFT